MTIMKNSKLYLILIIGLVLTQLSCKKEDENTNDTGNTSNANLAYVYTSYIIEEPFVGSEAGTSFGSVDSTGNSGLTYEIIDQTPSNTVSMDTNGTLKGVNLSYFDFESIDEQLTIDVLGRTFDDMKIACYGTYKAASTTQFDRAEFMIVVLKTNKDISLYNRTGTSSPFSELNSSYPSLEYYGSPTFIDLSGDGKKDIVWTTSSTSRPFYAINNCDSDTCYFTNQNSQYTFSLGVPGIKKPTFYDVDHDGTPELFIASQTGEINVYSANSSGLYTSDYNRNPFRQSASNFNLNVYGSYLNLAFNDFDQDGDQDLVCGERYGKILYFENVGAKTERYASNIQIDSFALRTANDNPFNFVDVGDYSCPTFTDWDQDGDQDLAVGNSGGKIYLYRKAGSSFANPFTITASKTTLDVGSFATPTFYDVDQDGDQDLVVGEQGGAFLNYFENLTTPRSLITEDISPNTGYYSDYKTLDELSLIHI